MISQVQKRELKEALKSSRIAHHTAMLALEAAQTVLAAAEDVVSDADDACTSLEDIYRNICEEKPEQWWK